MVLEIGSILEGKVTGITKFGAFVELPGGKNGMVHISEIASTYVKEITDFIKEDQVVKVKILAISPEGKINLSIKRAQEQPRPSSPTPPPKRPRVEQDWSGASKRQSSEPLTFEDMLSKFKSTSEDKISDLKRTMDPKKGSGRRPR